MKYQNVKLKRIPHARAELMRIARNCPPDVQREIMDVVFGLMFRNSSGKEIARKHAFPVDSDLVKSVLMDLKMNPHDAFRIIGRRHRVDGGRVAEIAQGLRTVEDPTMSRLKP